MCPAGGFEQQGTETPTKYGLSHKEFIFLQTKERSARNWKFSGSMLSSKGCQPPPHAGNSLPHGHNLDAAGPAIIHRHDNNV